MAVGIICPVYFLLHFFAFCFQARQQTVKHLDVGNSEMIQIIDTQTKALFFWSPAMEAFVIADFFIQIRDNRH